MQKTLLGYKLHVKKTKQTSLLNQDVATASITDAIKKEFRNAKAWDDKTKKYQDIPNKVIIEIIEVDDNYMFGSFGRLSDIGTTSLSRARDRENLTVEEFENLIENYTYFYVDVESLKISYMSNSKSKGFTIYFPTFLSTKLNFSDYFTTIDIIPYINDDFSQRFSKSKKIQKVDLKYTTDNEIISSYLPINELLNIEKGNILGVSLSLDLKHIKTTQSLLDKLLTIIKSNDPSIQKAMVVTEDEQFDFIEKVISKRIEVAIESNQLYNLDTIKDILKNNLEKF